MTRKEHEDHAGRGETKETCLLCKPVKVGDLVPCTACHGQGHTSMREMHALQGYIQGGMISHTPVKLCVYCKGTRVQEVTA